APPGDLVIGVGLEKLMTGSGHPTLRAVDHWHPPQTAVPRARRGELDPKEDPSVRELRRRVVLLHFEDERALERAIRVAGGEPSIFLVPDTVDGASPHSPVGLYVEEV